MMKYRLRRQIITVLMLAVIMVVLPAFAFVAGI